MSKPNIHFQTFFTNCTQNQINKTFNISDTDKILLAAWLSDSTKSIFLRKGLVFTQEGLAINFPVTTESNDSENKQEEPLSSNITFISKNNVTFLGTELHPTENDKQNELLLKTSDTVCSFSFDSEISLEKMTVLEQTITSYFTDKLNPSLYEKDDESYSINITVLAVKDCFIEATEIIKLKLKNIKSSISNKITEQKAVLEQKKSQKQRKEESTQKSENSNEQTSSRNSKIKSKKNKKSSDAQQPLDSQKPSKKHLSPVAFVNKVGAFFRHIIDLLTDILFMLALLFMAKPSLISENFFSNFQPFCRTLNFGIFASTYDSVFSTEILEKRNALFIILAGIFFILKTFISLSCKKNRKAVTFLIILMMISYVFIFKENILLFVLLELPLLFLLQFSMGFSGKAITTKTFFFIIICISGYLTIHIISYPELADLISQIKDILF